MVCTFIALSEFISIKDYIIKISNSIKELYDYDLIKKCTKCGNISLKSSFHKMLSSKDGLNPQCKNCRRQFYNENRDLILSQKKNYYNDNRDLILSQKKNYYNDNIVI